MIEITNLVTPSHNWWEAAIKGMRNPFKSRDKSDSEIKAAYDITENDCYNCSSYKSCGDMNGICGLIIGKKDKQLLLNLCKAGTSHRKVLRQLPVIMDIEAPLYFWKQLDQYKLGTVTNSESTMHCLTKEPFKLKDFSVENYRSLFGSKTEDQLKAFEELIVSDLNDLRDGYLETKDMKYWNSLNELLPQSYMQKRTWSANYEVLVNIIQQRKGHKLDEWNELINYWLENVPYLREVMEAVNESDKS